MLARKKPLNRAELMTISSAVTTALLICLYFTVGMVEQPIRSHYNHLRPVKLIGVNPQGRVLVESLCTRERFVLDDRAWVRRSSAEQLRRNPQTWCIRGKDIRGRKDWGEPRCPCGEDHSHVK